MIVGKSMSLELDGPGIRRGKVIRGIGSRVGNALFLLY